MMKLVLLIQILCLYFTATLSSDSEHKSPEKLVNTKDYHASLESETAAQELASRLVKISPEKKDYSEEQAHETTQEVVVPTPHSLFVDSFFSPNIIPMLIKFISEEEIGIKGTAYRLTHYEVAQELVNTQKRTAQVEFVIDAQHSISDDCTALHLMLKNGIRLFRSGLRNSRNKFETMHHKFVLFSKNYYHGPLLWTGSFNFTGAAEEYNWENVIVLNDPGAIEKYQEQYTKLLAISPQQFKLQDLILRKRNSNFDRINRIP